VTGAPAYSLDRVLVADLVREDDGRELAYATVRVAGNLGAFAGPPLAALLISAGGWSAFLIGIAALGLVGAAVTTLLLPETGGHLPRDLTEPGSLRLIARDGPFLLLLLSTMLGFHVYCGFETVLPVIAVSSYGLPAPTWGLLVAIGPMLIVLGQIRLTLAGSRILPARRMSAALLCMGLPFLIFILAHTVIVIAFVITVFIVGEMVWMPTSQMLAAELAPAHARGACLGAVGASTGVAWTITPFIALQLRTHIGVASVWIFIAAVAVAAVVAGLAAVRAAGGRHGL
jgi:predicted MFS family arabinose efflux permease